MPRKYANMRNTPVRISIDTQELDMRLKAVAKKISESNELRQALMKLGRDMQKQIMDTQRVENQFRHNHGAPLQQSGQLVRALRQMRPGVRRTDKGLTMHYGQLSKLNTETLRPIQRLMKRYRTGGSRTIEFKAERQFPAWVIAEFGIRGSATSPHRVNLAKFGIHYSRRPFTGSPIKVGTPEGGYRKPIYPNVNRQGERRKHPGIRAPRLFSSAVFLLKKDITSGRNKTLHMALRRILDRA